MNTDPTVVVEAAAERVPVEQRDQFMVRVAALLASHPATPSEHQVRLACRLASGEGQ
jgi:hypothetical protein